MNLSTSEEPEKSWDHPWTTDEMRLKQGEWSLAGDVGLLRHLQEFSETLTSRVKCTEKNLDLLCGDLNETTVLIDNVTNASLALANTQFIESRVHDDDPALEQQERSKKTEGIDAQKELSEAEMIAAVSDNIQRGLQIMDDKYDRLEVVASDDSEDDNQVSVPSFILRPKDPYRDRPLPYVIGSDKWKASNKIGLESSSESEAPDDNEDEDDEDEDESTEGDKITHIFNSNQRNNLLAARSSLSSSESSDFNDKSNNTNKLASGPSSTTDKMYTRSQDTLNSTSEIDTPIEVRSKSSGRDAPGFAEELAKRLGSVLPASKPDNSKADRSSINRSSDDLFANEEKNDEDVFNNKKDDLFSDGGLFDDDVPNSLWNNKPLRRQQSNIIPASIDLPPPMNSVEAKPKSSIDDLFGDVDSDDSDDIFAPKSSTKSSVTKDADGTSDKPKNKFAAGHATAEKVATSTPEINNSVPNLFDDDEDEDDSLFSSARNSAVVKSPETTKSSPRNRPRGVLISKADLLSSSLGSKIFQRARLDSSESSENEESVRFKEEGDKIVSTVSASGSRNSSSINISNKSNATQSGENDKSASTSSASTTIAGNRIHVRESSDSSGISVPPQSISSNLSTSLGLERPQMESTRLTSEELSRERLTSDSLLNQRTRQRADAVAVNSGRDVIISNPAPGVSVQENLSSRSKNNINSSSKEVNLFDDDVFSPPPLSKNDIKSKSKVMSLFDDSDSGEDLFSNTSSGSRSQKSADILGNSNNYLINQKQEAQEVKSKVIKQKNNLFDDQKTDGDIFGSVNVPDIDIFAGQKSKSNSPAVSSDLLSNKAASVNISEEIAQVKSLPSLLGKKSSNVGKTLSIFDDSDEEDDDLFSTNTKITKKPSNMFDGGGGGGKAHGDDDDLFRKLIQNKDREEEAVEEAARPKKDSAAVTSVEGEKKSKVKLDEKQNNSDQVPPSVDVTKVDGNLQSQTRRLFDDFAGEDSDDEDSLFGKKPVKSSVVSGGFDILKDSVVNIKETKITSVQSAEIDKYCEDTDSVSTTDGGIMSRINHSKDTATTGPPKSLKIKLPIPTGIVDDDNDNDSVSPPRRAVSGKIKDLMGKMGDLKILSPTDTPLVWRKAAGDKQDSENDNTPDRDSEDGSSISIPSTKSPTVVSDENIYKKDVSLSPSIETETAVSFDVPAQAETLTIKGSKILQNRARIPVKRRPQSRQARQTALRTSGLDFETTDTTDSSGAFDSSDLSSSKADTKNDRVTTIHTNDDSRDETVVKNKHQYLNLTGDDRSEISISKDGSISTTKNTLLSPSTDEEDLFDVPPDLPEDPPKEDSLFDEAPILSPVQVRRSKNHFENRYKDGTATYDKLKGSINKSTENQHRDSEESRKRDRETVDKEDRVPVDPLHDDNHDPLKDPSQLFAFVTKTPSPERGQGLLFDEDDSLFSTTGKKEPSVTSSTTTTSGESTKKSALDLFEDDSASDLFSGPFTKPVKKPVKSVGVKSSLFNDLDSEDDETDDLFASASSRKSNLSKSELSDTDISAAGTASKHDGIEDDDEEELFFDASEKPDSSKDQPSAVTTPAAATDAKKTKNKLGDIFGEQSSGEDDIFFTKKPIAVSKVGSLFSNEGESDDDLFSIKKQPAPSGSASQSGENLAPVKKSVTRDLKKTAETIVEDPLSMLHDD
ncbi:WASH complex subunit 2 isoform X1 [Microplitis demolitor]|uniref:WASH complex subunit 2 isoform X1 n=1 Tax=Microplitis demolitor TaxID=69319 RepID=UPI0004CCCFB8|nr:WASH complex subunit 2 isoform X1 [Microplitis demolitor]